MTTLQVITHKLDTHGKPLVLVPLADLHFGDSHVDQKHIQELVDYIKHTENCYCILDGDCMNTAVTGSKSDVYGEIMPPSLQLRKCVEIFSPLAKDGKILAVLTGNHEERIQRSVGVNLTEVMAAELDIPNLYSATSTLLYLKFGQTKRHHNKQQVYAVYINHGFGGGGRRVGSKLNSLEDMSRIVTDCDIYICGHTHLPAVFRQSCYVCDRQNMYARQQEQVYVNTASSLNWSGSYGDRMGFKPNSMHYPVIELDDKVHKVTVTL